MSGLIPADLNPVLRFCRENGCSFLEDEPLSGHTSFHIGGPARLFLQPDRTDTLTGLIGLLGREKLPWVVLGNGSNILAGDEGFSGVVVHIGAEFSGICLEEEGQIRCRAGTSLAALSRFAAGHSLTGLEFSCGIPGSVGGAVYMNAGAYGGEISQRLVSVTQLTVPTEGEPFLEELPAGELELGYRHSRYQSPDCRDIILEALFCLEPGEREVSLAQMEHLLKSRRDKQPLEYPSAGSAFKRPEGSYASLLIDQCGLKGLTVGGAQISEKHAGFIVNRGGATCADVLELIGQVQQRVLREPGFRLEPEVRLLKG